MQNIPLSCTILLENIKYNPRFSVSYNSIKHKAGKLCLLSMESLTSLPKERCDTNLVKHFINETYKCAIQMCDKERSFGAKHVFQTYRRTLDFFETQTRF